MITIGLPFYNADIYLESAIISILNQKFQEWELILLDDGSTDSSLDIAYKYQKIDPRIIVVSDGFNRGLPARLNQISNLCVTKYLARMDADDIMHPLKLKRQYEILISDNSIDVLGTNAFSIDDKDRVIGRRIKEKEGVSIVKSFIHPTIVGKTEWFKNNPYNENAIRIEDAELWNRTHEFSVFKRLNEPLFFYREYGGNYYRKYIKVIPSLIDLLSKNNFDYFWVKKTIKSIICVPLYFFTEKIIKTDFMIKKRNGLIFDQPKSISTLLDNFDE